jgi:hypothetical protein
MDDNFEVKQICRKLQGNYFQVISDKIDKIWLIKVHIHYNIHINAVVIFNDTI